MLQCVVEARRQWFLRSEFSQRELGSFHRGHAVNIPVTSCRRALARKSPSQTGLTVPLSYPYGLAARIAITANRMRNPYADAERYSVRFQFESHSDERLPFERKLTSIRRLSRAGTVSDTPV